MLSMTRISATCCFACLFALSSSLSGFADEWKLSQGDKSAAAATESELRSLVFSGKQLHPSLKIRPVEKPLLHMRDGMKLAENPFISTDEEFVEVVSRSSSMGRIPRAGIQTALYAAYEAGEAVLLFRGLEAISALDADWREAALRKIWAHNMKFGRVQIHRQGLLVLVVWHKGLPEDCWKAVNAKLSMQMNRKKLNLGESSLPFLERKD